MRRETAGAVQACLLTAVDVSRHMATAPQRDEAAKQRNRAVGMRTEEEACAAPTGERHMAAAIRWNRDAGMRMEDACAAYGDRKEAES